MGGKRIAQKNGGPRRPRYHSGRSGTAQDRRIHEADLEASLVALTGELLAKIEIATKMENELANERGKTAALETELAEERGKTSALQAEVHDLSSRVRHLADLSQRQQLDIQSLRIRG